MSFIYLTRLSVSSGGLVEAYAAFLGLFSFGVVSSLFFLFYLSETRSKSFSSVVGQSTGSLRVNTWTPFLY